MKTDMQAMVIHHYGKGPVSLERMPLPSMSPYEVRVKIKAASINPIDFKIRDGGLKMLLTYQFPLILGNDFAGEVYEVGDKVTQFKVGDKVYGRPRKSKIGTFAEYISVNAEEIAPMPKGLSYEEAASIPLVGLTAYQAINEVIQAQPGTKYLFKLDLAVLEVLQSNTRKLKDSMLQQREAIVVKNSLSHSIQMNLLIIKNKTSQRYSKTSTVYLIRLEERTSRNRSKFLSHMASSRPFQDCQLNVTHEN